MIAEILTNTEALPEKLSADAGFFSEVNVEGLMELGIDPYIAIGRFRHFQKPLPPPRGRIPRDASPKERMGRKLRTRQGRGIDSQRKVIVERVFGQIKGRGFRKFLLRGGRKARGE